MTMEERFMSHVKKTAGCWLWVGSIHHKGYGQFLVNRKVNKAHRVSYELFVGKIPTGKQLDHLCRVRNCVNPNHLEPVTNRENVIRGNTSLKRKHKYPLGAYNTGGRFWSSKRINGKSYYLGCFDSAQKAHEAYLSFEGV